ncbi:MAG: peroxidase-related enzyme [Thermoplasmatota archaeon]
MAWIKVIDESDADERLKMVYDELKKKRGKIANILKIHSLLPETMKDHMQLYTHIMFNKSTISREDKELIAVVVSKLNNCSYCIHHHVEALNFYWKDKKRIERFLKTNDYSCFSAKQQAMLKYAEKLTKSPDKIKESEVVYLREQGLTDKEILEVALIVSYFNFVNRMALGLHVTFTHKEMSGYNY